MHSLISSFSEYLLSFYDVLSTSLSAGNSQQKTKQEILDNINSTVSEGDRNINKYVNIGIA